MSVKQIHVTGVLLFCGLLALLGTFFLLRQITEQGVVPAPVAPNATVVLDDETERLAPGAWRAVPVNVPFSGLLQIRLHVVRGNPIDVIFIDEGNLNSFRDNGWGKTTGSPAFEAARIETYERLSDVAKGNYYLVYRDAFLGVLSTDSTDVSLRISLSPLARRSVNP